MHYGDEYVTPNQQCPPAKVTNENNGAGGSNQIEHSDYVSTSSWGDATSSFVHFFEHGCRIQNYDIDSGQLMENDVAHVDPS